MLHSVVGGNPFKAKAKDSAGLALLAGGGGCHMLLTKTVVGKSNRDQFG